MSELSWRQFCARYSRRVCPFGLHGRGGEPLLRFGSEVVDFRTPFSNRWAGWYVTGKHGTALHRGNVLAQDKNGELVVDLKRGANVADLSRFFETKSYLAPGSDIVALLVFEHQLAMQNTLTRASQDCRRMLAYQKNLQRDLKEPVTEELTYDSVKRVFEGAAKDLVDDLLFKGEAHLPQGLEGSAAFQGAFQAERAAGPRRPFAQGFPASRPSLPESLQLSHLLGEFSHPARGLET